jgi:cation transport ATPase
MSAALVATTSLDKTGTMTLGVSKVTGIVAANGASEEAILQFAVIAEQHSESGPGPLARMDSPT